MTETEELERQRSHVRNTVFAGIARRRVIRQRRIIALVAGAGLLAAAGVAIGATRAAPEQPPGVVNSTVVCYLTRDLSHPQFIQMPPEELTEAVAREVCSQESRYDDEDLAICLDPEGVRALIPMVGDETEREVCTRLGIAVWDDSFADE